MSACGTPPEPATFSHAEALDSLGAAALVEGPLAGLAIAIARQGELVYERGFGLSDVDSQTPATSQTVFNIASTAKILAATAIMRLMETGAFGPDDTLASLLPNLPNAEATAGITVRQLLSMTSGLRDYVAADIQRLQESQEPLQPEFVLDFVRANPLQFEPGSDWMYSNTGFYLAGLIVERVSGRPWAEFMRAEVLEPLGLTETWLCDDVVTTRSRGYEFRDGSFYPSLIDAERGIRGDAGLCSTVRDLARLPGALKSGGVISDASLKAMVAPTQLRSGLEVDYGMGVSRGSYGGHTMWGHLGGSGSIVSALAHYPDDSLTISVLVNTRDAAVGALLLEGYVADIVFSLEPQLRDEPVSDSLALQLIGTYVGDRERSHLEILLTPDGLTRRSPGAPAADLPLLLQHGRTFGRADWPNDRFIFLPSHGQALAFSAYYNGFFDGFYSRSTE